MNESEAKSPVPEEKKCPQCGAPLPSGALEGLCPACLLKQGVTETATQPEAAPFEPPTLQDVAKLFPQLELIAFVGKGGMGAVYKARQPALDRFVALKILPPQLATGPGFAERFNREARALARLSHPNIVAVHEFGQAAGLPFLIMEFVDGLNLRELERAGKLAPRQALGIVPQICEALQFAHDEGIVHRDIKPENILLDKKGRVKIADFGIAKILGREAVTAMSETKGAIGTPHYMAPEQVEKPQAVDHRADIFSLGVVFYEMLTGELPLGKFAPPSRRVEVDVRLDDVVLRALEKEPERRYQQASQVKTAVETIAATAAPTPAPDAEAFTREILARDYRLDIGSCVRRGWALVRSDFWPFVGITALVFALLAVAGSVGSSSVIGPGQNSVSNTTSVLYLLLNGPLMGGLYLYLLKRMRSEPGSIETVFSGFSNRFLHLFLGSFVTFALTTLGFVCFILPGVYLLVAWLFTLPLIADKRLDFWPAMELSRKTVSKHWWKFLTFGIVLLVLSFAGLAACVVGLFVALPIVLAAMLYAYEDLFGHAAPMAQRPSPAFGPSGTEVMSATPALSPLGASRSWKPALIGIVVAVLALFIVATIFANLVHKRRVHRVWFPPATEPAAFAEPVQSAETIPELVLGPVHERVIEFTNSDRRALNLVSGNFVVPGQGVESAFGDQGADYLRNLGVDLFFPREEPGVAPHLTSLDWRMLCDAPSGNPDTEFNTVESVTPQVVQSQLDLWNGEQWKTNGTDPGFAGLLSGVKARNLKKHEEDIADQNVKLFITREGTAGVLQMVGSSEEPPGLKIRYRLADQTPVLQNRLAASTPAEPVVAPRRTLSDRLEAAALMSNVVQRDEALAALAISAAQAGEAGIIQSALREIHNTDTEDQAALESVRLLAQQPGRHKQALDIAKSIHNPISRDQALAELAQ